MNKKQIIQTVLGAAVIISLFVFASRSDMHLAALQKNVNLAAVSGVGSSLIGHYAFDGNTNDSAGSTQGAITGAPSYGQGIIGQAISFNGTSDYVSLGDYSEIEDVQQYSISAWIKSNASENISGSDIFLKKEGSGADTFTFSWSQSEDINFCVIGPVGTSCPGTGSATAAFTKGVPVGSGMTWHHVVGVYDGAAGQVRVYVNGVQGDVVASLSGASKNSVHPFLIGSTWNGLIDDVRIYNRALSSADVSELYALGGGSTQPQDPNPTNPPTNTDPQQPTTPTAPTTPTNPGTGAPTSVRTSMPAPVQWAAPIGVPEPVNSFLAFDPIRGTHFMYQLQSGETCGNAPNKCFDFGNGPEAYRDGGAGPYTHYMHPGSSLCTDTNNIYGTHERPRCSLPAMSSMLPGSVLEIHGMQVAGAARRLEMTAAGTPQKPIFIRGASPTDRGGFSGYVFRVRGGNIVYENLNFNATSPDIRPAAVTDPNISNVVFRNNHLYGTNSSIGATGLTGNTTTNIVYYNNKIYPTITVTYADNLSTGAFDPNSLREFRELDVMNIAIGSNAQNLWVLDNDLSLATGDNVGNAHGANYTAKNLYVGRNLLHDSGENAVDLKEIENVVVSQNKMYNFKGGSTGSTGGAFVVHYGPQFSPKNVWVLFNEIYDAKDTGIQIGGSQEYPVYFIGNIIHDITNPNGTGVAFNSWASNDIYLLNNTVYNVDRGIDFTSTGSATPYIQNNIIANMANPSQYHLFLDNSAYRANSQLFNNVFYQSDGPARIRYGSAMNLATLKSTTGKCAGCIEADPKFVNPAADDYRLQSDSPAIDTGSSALMTTLATLFNASFGIDVRKDFLGTPRPQGSAMDIGAVEWYSGQPASNPNPSLPGNSNTGSNQGSNSNPNSGSQAGASSGGTGNANAQSAAGAARGGVGTGSGSGGASENVTVIPGCSVGNLFSTVTGQRCPASVAGGSVQIQPTAAQSVGNSNAYVFLRNLNIGSRGEDVRSLQRSLNGAGYVVANVGIGSAGNESAYFGLATKAALMRFQREKGLIADGVFGPRTRAAIQALYQTSSNADISTGSAIATQIAPVSESASALKLGAYGNEVKVLRQKLRAAGYLAPYGSSAEVPASASAETSNFGITTETALKKYQCDKSIVCSGAAPVTGWGVVGPRTKAMLGI